MTTKREIAIIFRKLTKFGYKVKSFGNNRRGRNAQTGWVDTVIFNSKYFVCIEIKTKDTGDKFSDEQKETAKLLSSIMTHNKTFYYEIITSVKDAQKYHDRILKGDL